MSTPTPDGSGLRRSLSLRLCVTLSVLVFAHGSFAQKPPVTPPPATPVAAQYSAPSVTPLPVGSGLCQCIADFNALVFSCPGSAQACESSCGRKFSFVPYQQCPMPAPH